MDNYFMFHSLYLNIHLSLSLSLIHKSICCRNQFHITYILACLHYCGTMRAAAGGNPLDLNNLPGDQDHGRLLLDDTSSSAPPGEGGRRRRNGIGGSNDEIGKLYECRFCSLKFGKSQALGGHMNRHRQERETETLNRARQLVFTTDNLIPSPTHLLGGQPVMQHGAYHPQPGQDPYRSMYPAPRLFSGSSSSTIIPPPPPPPSFMYAPSSRLAGYPPPHYNINPQPPNDCLVGHVLPGANTQSYANYTATPQDTNYTCIGAPVSYCKRSDMGSTLPNNNNFGNNIEEGIDEGDQMALNMNRGWSFARGGGGTSPMINNRYN